MNRNLLIFTIIAIGLSTLTGCGNCGTKTESQTLLPNNIWNRFTPFEDTFEITNIDKVYDIDLSFGVMNNFAFDFLRIEIVITSPDGQKNIINQMLDVKKDSHFLGTAIGDVWTIEHSLYKQKTFTTTGTYTIKIQHRMDYVYIENVAFIGFTVQPVRAK